MRLIYRRWNIITIKIFITISTAPAHYNIVLSYDRGLRNVFGVCVYKIILRPVIILWVHTAQRVWIERVKKFIEFSTRIKYSIRKHWPLARNSIDWKRSPGTRKWFLTLCFSLLPATSLGRIASEQNVLIFRFYFQRTYKSSCPPKKRSTLPVRSRIIFYCNVFCFFFFNSYLRYDSRRLITISIIRPLSNGHAL